MRRAEDEDGGCGPRRHDARSRLVPALAVLCAVALGVVGGLGMFTFGYGDGAAYLKDDPVACANCHVMQGHLDSWMKSSHRTVATCNDCHLPHDPLGKWITKVDNGLFHSLAFTTNRFPEPIRIKDRNRKVTQGACVSCHADLVGHMLVVGDAADSVPACVRCHGDVGHAGRSPGLGAR